MKKYLTGAIISWVLIAGWINAYDKKESALFCSYSDRREILGSAIIQGFIGAIIWPAFVPGIYCFTGFAVNGWSLSTK